MSERDRMFGSSQGKGDTPRPCDLKKFRDRYPKGMGKKAKKEGGATLSRQTPKDRS